MVLNNYGVWIISWVYKFSTTVMGNKTLLLNWKRFTKIQPLQNIKLPLYCILREVSGGANMWKNYCRFSLSHHHQNHSTKVKNERDKRRWIFKQSGKDSGLCDVSCGRYSKKSSTQIYKALYGDAMFVSLWRTQIWRAEANKNMSSSFATKSP